MREEQELPDNGEAALREGSRQGGGDGHEIAVALQEECPDNHYRQRHRVLRTQEDIGGAQDPCIFRRQLLILAEGRD